MYYCIMYERDIVKGIPQIYICNNNVTRTTVIRLPVSCSRAVILILGIRSPGNI